MKDREAIYDTLITPLMERITDLCEAHDIPMVASFQINDDRAGDEDEHLATTWVMPDEHSDLLHEVCEVLDLDGDLEDDDFDA